MSNYDLKIGGVSVGCLYESISITETTNGRNKMSATVFVSGSVYRPGTWQTAEVFEDGTLIFSGAIETPTEEGFGNIGWSLIQTRIEAIDHNELPDRRIISIVFPIGRTMKQCMQDLIPYLTGYGVSLDPAQIDGSALTTEARYDDQPVTDILNDLSALFTSISGVQCVWEVTYTLLLRMFTPSTHAAPYDVGEGDGTAIGDMIVRPSLSNFGNYVILRFSSAALKAYAFLAPGANVVDADTVTIGSQTYTFQSSFVDASGNVAIGTTLDHSLDNLVAAIMHGAGAGTVYGAATPIHSSVEAYIYRSGQIAARALTAGASGNSIAVATHGSIAPSWFGEGAIPVITLQLGADQSLSSRVFASDAASIVARGRRDRLVDRPDIFDPAIAQILCNDALSKFLLEIQEITYVTYEKGAHPGMVQDITAPSRNVTGNCLITDVKLAMEQGDLDLRRTVTAFGSTTLPIRWQDLAASGLFGQGGGGSFGGGGGSSVTLVTATGRTLYPLGGVRSEFQRSPIAYPSVSSWVSATGVRVQIDSAARGTVNATVVLSARVLQAGYGVWFRLRDVMNNVTAGVNSGAVSTTTLSLLSFPVILTVGVAHYELQMAVTQAGKDANVVGAYLE